jgi:hypothetical protein
LRDPRSSAAAMPALSASDIADRRHRLLRNLAADAGWLRHALLAKARRACPTSSWPPAPVKPAPPGGSSTLMQAMIERDRRYMLNRRARIETTTPISAVSAPAGRRGRGR